MTRNIKGMRDILAKMSSFHLLFVLKLLKFLKCLDRLCVKNVLWNYEK